MTNRPKSVPLGFESEETDTPEHEDISGDPEHHLNVSSSLPLSVSKNRRMFKRIENVRTSLSEYRSPSVSSRSPTSYQHIEGLRRSVREKILKRDLNIKPILRPITSAEGYVSSVDLRVAMNRLNLELSEDELSACCPIDGRVNAVQFLKSLEVPDYEYGSYDPLGNSSKREVAWLSHLQQTWRERVQQATSSKKSEISGDPRISDETFTLKNARQDSQNLSQTWSRNELRKVADITKKLERVGVPLFELTKGIDKDGSGNVKKEDLEAALKKTINFGMVKGQVNDLWSQADQLGTKNINFLELQNAITTMEAKTASALGVISGGEAASSTGPRWGDTRTGRSPCLPSCHYNVRSRKMAVPRNTNEVVVPLEDSFAYCPDWMRATSVRLDNPWIMDGTGQGVVAKNRLAANLERRRAVQARMLESVERREERVETRDAARLNGIARVRHDWIASMQGIWA